MPLAAVLLGLRGLRLRRPPRVPFLVRRARVKLAVDLTATSAGSGTLVATETRIAATSEDARRAFGRYRRIVRPGSDLVRASWLRAAERRVTVGS